MRVFKNGAVEYSDKEAMELLDSNTSIPFVYCGRNDKAYDISNIDNSYSDYTDCPAGGQCSCQGVDYE